MQKDIYGNYLAFASTSKDALNYTSVSHGFDNYVLDLSTTSKDALNSHGFDNHVLDLSTTSKNSSNCTSLSHTSTNGSSNFTCTSKTPSNCTSISYDFDDDSLNFEIAQIDKMLNYEKSINDDSMEYEDYQKSNCEKSINLIEPTITKCELDDFNDDLLEYEISQFEKILNYEKSIALTEPTVTNTMITATVNNLHETNNGNEVKRNNTEHELQNSPKEIVIHNSLKKELHSNCKKRHGDDRVEFVPKIQKTFKRRKRVFWFFSKKIT